MKETTIISFITAFLLVSGTAASYFSINYSGFNFYKSEITINNLDISEKIYYKPNKEYHTLFRNFMSRLTINKNLDLNDCIFVKNVECSEGTAYARDYRGNCLNYNAETQNYCMRFTENNEYGCSFGGVLGFKKNKDYWIKADYSLNPSNLFFINRKYYVKFVIYSKKRHAKLQGSNFIVKSNKDAIVKKEKYYPIEDVVVYIPYNGNTAKFNIIREKNFQFGDSKSKIVILYLFNLFPGLAFLIVWFFFGRENSDADIPEQLSQYPVKRKGWEVAAYFNPPFSVIDKNFFSTILLDFYHRKIIDINYESKAFVKKLWIKILKPAGDSNLDKTEKIFLDILKGINEQSSDKFRKNGYFNLSGAMASWNARTFAAKRFKKLGKQVKEHGKNYLEQKGNAVLSIALVIWWMSFLYLLDINLFMGPSILAFLSIIFFSYVITAGFTSLMIRFKDNYYKEYLHWQSFKKWLSDSFSMKNSEYDAIVLWEDYLIYATALGVSSKIIKKLKQQRTISNREYNIYMGVYFFSGSFAPSGASIGGGGGGIGGGGGGGR